MQASVPASSNLAGDTMHPTCLRALSYFPVPTGASLPERHRWRTSPYHAPCPRTGAFSAWAAPHPAFVRRSLPAYSEVVGSIIFLTSETRLAGNPPCLACSRTIFSFGAM